MGAKVVSVTITRQTAAVTRAGFGVPLVFAAHDKPALVLEFNEPSDMLGSGVNEFASTDDAYRVASTLMAQNPSPQKFLVGKATGVAMTATLTVALNNFTEGREVPLSVNGTDVTITLSASETDDEDVATALAAGIDAVPGVSATSAAAVITVTSDDANQRFYLSDFYGEGAFELSYEETTDTDTTADFATEISDIRDLNDTWYGLVSSFESAGDIEALADVIESTNKIFAATTHDSAVATTGTGTIAETLKNSAYDRTSLWFNPEGGEYDAAGIMGFMLTTTPGEGTWAHKSLSAVAVSDLSEGQYSTLEAQNCNYYREMGGSGSTWDGSAASGEYIDTMRLVDWTEARVSENVLQVFKVQPKIPFSNAGIATITGPIKATLDQGVTNGGYLADPEPKVTAPDISEISDNDKANRILPDVKFSAVLAGAIHQVVIKGTVSLS